MIKLLLVEDDKNLSYIVQSGLQDIIGGYEVITIRETDGDTPILFASALTSPKDVRKGYDIGVNNYVKKPFIPDELDAHLHAILKMKEGSKTRDESGMCKFGKYTLDAGHATLHNNESGNNTTLDCKRGTGSATACRKQRRGGKKRGHPEPLLGQE